MPIFTTGNVIKKGEMWCDNADEITQTALTSGGYTWDSEWPIQFGLDTCGLGNALLALGAPLPRYRNAAKLVEALYIKYLYGKGLELATRHDYTVMDTRQWLDREDRKVSCLAHASIWADTKIAAPNAAHANLAHGMQMIFSADRSLMIRNVFGTRHLMTAQLLLEGEKSSNATINDLKDYLRKELDHV
jgi:hypothetical protein